MFVHDRRQMMMMLKGVLERSLLNVVALPYALWTKYQIILL